jgi:hypothetical protein
MFALPLAAVPSPTWLKVAAVSGFLTTLAFVVLSILPIVAVQSQFTFALKISTVIVVTNLIGFALFRNKTR